MQVWDLGGQDSIRPYWRCYLPNTDALIYVIDSSDYDRLGLARDVLNALMQEEELRTCPVMVLANKQDVHGAMSEVQILECLGLKSVKDRHWTVLKTSAIQGQGIQEALEWLASHMTRTV
jgi:ADP-ribosylation factor-like protein 1